MADDRDGMEEGYGATGRPVGADPRAVSGGTIWHDTAAPLPEGRGSGGRHAARVVHPYPLLDGFEVRTVYLRATVWTDQNDTQEELEDKLDRVFVGEVGPHLPVVTYSYFYDQEEEGVATHEDQG